MKNLWLSCCHRIPVIFFSLAGGLFSTLLLAGCSSPGAGIGRAHWGEFGGNLDVLRAACQGPQLPGESNLYIDLLGYGLRSTAVSQGLINNHTLFVLSHGKAVSTDFGLRYAFCPEGSGPGVPSFSPSDLARVLGPNASQVHILVLAGCNTENMFYPREFKRCFPNVTNIIHAVPGTDATVASFQEVLRHNSLVLGSRETSGRFSTAFGPPPSSLGGNYVAELFKPGARKPYKKQIAGRELLTGSAEFQTAQSRTNNFPSGSQNAVRD